MNVIGEGAQGAQTTDLEQAFAQIDNQLSPDRRIGSFGELAALGYQPAADAAISLARDKLADLTHRPFSEEDLTAFAMAKSIDPTYKPPEEKWSEEKWGWEYAIARLAGDLTEGDFSGPAKTLARELDYVLPRTQAFINIGNAGDGEGYSLALLEERNCHPGTRAANRNAIIAGLIEQGDIARLKVLQPSLGDIIMETYLPESQYFNHYLVAAAIRADDLDQATALAETFTDREDLLRANIALASAGSVPSLERAIQIACQDYKKVPRHIALRLSGLIFKLDEPPLASELCRRVIADGLEVPSHAQ